MVRVDPHICYKSLGYRPDLHPGVVCRFLFYHDLIGVMR